MCDINYIDVQFNSIQLDNEINFIYIQLYNKNVHNKANVRTPVHIFGSEPKIK